MTATTSNTVHAQNSGNPVLDSTINTVTAMVLAGSTVSDAMLRQIHTVILELAKKEPGGLRYPIGMNEVE